MNVKVDIADKVYDCLLHRSGHPKQIPTTGPGILFYPVGIIAWAAWTTYLYPSWAATGHQGLDKIEGIHAQESTGTENLCYAPRRCITSSGSYCSYRVGKIRTQCISALFDVFSCLQSIRSQERASHCSTAIAASSNASLLSAPWIYLAILKTRQNPIKA